MIGGLNFFLIQNLKICPKHSEMVKVLWYVDILKW
jgi:hypothetical protein